MTAQPAELRINYLPELKTIVAKRILKLYRDNKDQIEIAIYQNTDLGTTSAYEKSNLFNYMDSFFRKFAFTISTYKYRYTNKYEATDIPIDDCPFHLNYMSYIEELYEIMDICKFFNIPLKI